MDPDCHLTGFLPVSPRGLRAKDGGEIMQTGQRSWRMGYRVGDQGLCKDDE